MRRSLTPSAIGDDLVVGSLAKTGNVVATDLLQERGAVLECGLERYETVAAAATLNDRLGEQAL